MRRAACSPERGKRFEHLSARHGTPLEDEPGRVEGHVKAGEGHGGQDTERVCHTHTHSLIRLCVCVFVCEKERKRKRKSP